MADAMEAWRKDHPGRPYIAARRPPDTRDLAVLSELGETVAYALSALETRETLRTDRVVELKPRKGSRASA